ncbi:gamma-aminobutyric acid type B receptor subunit 2-like [Ptychodera flava]|uniref:gamma-aminobutyric acid type B receptor subunit 2-like n=1 Tax=Ptychodera flava TaxID=63121 RepID=UPI00396A8400
MAKLYTVMVAVVLTSLFTVVKTENMTLYISGMMALKGLPWGWGIRPAIELALHHVNGRADVLPGYTLKWIVNDTWADPGHGTKVFVEHISHPPTKLMILGPAYSSVTKSVAQTAPHYNLVEVSPSATSPEFSDRSKFPLLFRTIQSDLSHNPPRVALLKYFGWKRVATLHQNQALWSTTTGKLHDGLSADNITMISFAAFDNDPQHQIQQLKEKDARIILGLFWSPPARVIFCEAYKRGLYGKNYVWIINGGRPDYWWHPTDSDEDELLKRGCTKDDIEKAVEGVIFTDYAYSGEEDVRGVSGFTPSEIWDLYMDLLLTNFTDQESEKSPFAYFAYDSLWSIALTLNNSMNILPNGKKLEDFSYRDVEMANIFKEEMQKTNFIGASGSIRFTDEGDRLGRVTVHQIQRGEEVLIGYYYQYEDKFIWLNEFQWKGGHPPPDSQTVLDVILSVDNRLVIAMDTLAFLGVIAGISCLAFNIKNRNIRYIKMSSPRLNNVICLGSIVMYISVFLFGLDDLVQSTTALSLVCNVRIWIVSFGFTLTFGSLFTKTWRVHYIFFNKKLEKRVVKDKHLFGMIGVLLLFDIAILTSWCIIDPIHRDLIEFENYVTQDGDDADVLVYPVKNSCTSNDVTKWIVILYSYKGVLILFGLFLAWETRNVKMEALNDSKHIGLCVYNVMILSVIGVSVVNILSEHQFDASFTVTSLSIICCTSSVLAIVFVPKVIKVRNNDVDILNTAAGTHSGPVSVIPTENSEFRQTRPMCDCDCHSSLETEKSSLQVPTASCSSGKNVNSKPSGVNINRHSVTHQ